MVFWFVYFYLLVNNLISIFIITIFLIKIIIIIWIISWIIHKRSWVEDMGIIKINLWEIVGWFIECLVFFIRIWWIGVLEMWLGVSSLSEVEEFWLDLGKLWWLWDKRFWIMLWAVAKQIFGDLLVVVLLLKRLGYVKF
jgi:hypothetical protein